CSQLQLATGEPAPPLRTAGQVRPERRPHLLQRDPPRGAELLPALPVLQHPRVRVVRLHERLARDTRLPVVRGLDVRPSDAPRTANLPNPSVSSNSSIATALRHERSPVSSVVSVIARVARLWPNDTAQQRPPPE